VAEITAMNSPILISSELIRQTLAQLQHVGRRKSECVILWLGKRNNGALKIQQAWVPEQKAGYGFFDIPESSMHALFTGLRKHRLIVAAQVHTHPRQAFHSYADDKWAIVRHTGALSLVLPDFALRTTIQTFFHESALFVLSLQNEWLEVPASDRHNFYQITQ
jgi:hypothetical protein